MDNRPLYQMRHSNTALKTLHALGPQSCKPHVCARSLAAACRPPTLAPPTQDPRLALTRRPPRCRLARTHNKLITSGPVASWTSIRRASPPSGRVCGHRGRASGCPSMRRPAARVRTRACRCTRPSRASVARGHACDGIARPQRCRRGARRWREPWDTRRLLGVLPRSHQTTSGDAIEPLPSPPPRAPARLSAVPRSLFDLSSPPTLAPNGRTSPRAVPLDVVQRAGPWACLGRAAPRGLPVPAELAASHRRRCGCVSFLTISDEPWQQRHGCLSSACAASAMSVSSLRC